MKVFIVCGVVTALFFGFMAVSVMHSLDDVSSRQSAFLARHSQ